MNRKKLIKMKNGRHRVATAEEATMMEDARKASIRERDLQAENFAIKASVARRLAGAREEGASMVLQTKYLPEMTREMGVRLGQVLGEELRPHAEKLLQAHRNRRPERVLSLSASIEDARINYLTIEGRVPELHYRMVVA